MREYTAEEELKKTLRVLFKKDTKRYQIVLKKIQEIVSCDDIDHYKNLHSPLQHLKRVHINTHFVLVFRYDKGNDSVHFYDLDHHENIYKKK